MSCGLLIITHNQIGEALLQTATHMLGFCPLLAHTLAVTPECNPDQLRERARVLARDLDQGDGVLVLTDMFGSTPSNIATALGKAGQVSVVSGINLPMLVRVLNYPHLSLERITDKALSGGRDGILDCQERTKPLIASN
jgi:PTS system ascorbate-specific IIA component